MSGLWSFREAVSLTPAYHSVVRTTLPAATDHDHDERDDDDDESAGAHESPRLFDHAKAPSPADIVELFGTVPDVEEVVRDAQAAWLERTVGAAESPRGAWPSPATGGPDSTAADPSPDAEDLAVARALLRGVEEKEKCTERQRPVGASKGNARGAQRGAVAPYAFVQRMERRAAQRREARTALKFRQQDREQRQATAMAVSTAEMDMAHKIPSSKDPQGEETDPVKMYQGTPAKDVKLRRWYFVLWVAFVEMSREGRARTNRLW